MRGDIIWAGVAVSNIQGLSDIIIEEPPKTNRPKRKVDRYKVPGRNGDIIVPQDAWENVPRNYPVFFHGNYDVMASLLMEWLYAPSGYQRLWDTFDSKVYRLAYVSEDTDIDNVAIYNGRCTLRFECDPRRFLLSGEEAYGFSGNDTIVNPTRFLARPQITVHGSGNGSVTIGGNTITITGIYDGMVLDCDAQDAYYGAINCNNLISGSFPVIPGGEQEITITGGITSVEVTPNWWTL